MSLGIRDAYIDFDEQVTPPSTPNAGALRVFAGERGNLASLDEHGQRILGGGVIFVQTNDVTVANTTAETSILGTGDGSLTLAANMLHLARAIRIEVLGVGGTVGTPTLEIRVELGGVLICTSGAITMPSGLSNGYFELDAFFTVRAVGGAGSVQGGGRFEIASTFAGLPNASQSTIDTTVAQTLDVTVIWGTANASNTITTQQAFIEILN